MKKGQHTLMKIGSLAIGLALGLVLIAKVAFEGSYDGSYKDSDRIFMVAEAIPDRENPDGEWYVHPRTAGGVVVYMRERIPEIETSTRFTALGYGSTFTLTDTENKIQAGYAVADSCFFDILSLKVLQGNPKEVLSSPLQVMVSESTAKKIGEDAVGRTLLLDGGDERAVLTVGGIFEDFPENSQFSHLDMLVSMPSISWYTWDGSMNLLGNDRYTSLIKVRDVSDLEKIQQQTDELIEEVAGEYLREAGTGFGIRFLKLGDYHTSDSQVRNMMLMLSLIAIALLATAILNYILLSISAIIGRTKDVAVRKCYGATGGNIMSMLLGESALHTFIAVCLAAVLLLSFRGPVESLTGTSLEGLFLSGRTWILVAVCIAIALLTGAVPGKMLSNIPVASVMRTYRASKRRWKLAMLSLQIAAATFLVALLIVISGQYRLMNTAEVGYEYDNLAFVDIASLGYGAHHDALINEIQAQAEVESVSESFQLLISPSNGDNVLLPGDSRELFNCADLYYHGRNYFETMEIPVIQGSTFNEDLRPEEEVMISRKFTETLARLVGWDASDVIGKEIYITSFDNPLRICGVYEDPIIGSWENRDERPSMMVYGPGYTENLLVKYTEISPEALNATQNILERLYPDKDLHIYPYADEVEQAYIGTRKFRDAILIGGIITLLIVFIGIIGYTSDEVNRRRKEIAIRKINGAGANNIVLGINSDLLKIGLTSVIAGIIVSLFVASGWQEQFAVKLGLPWYIFLLAAVATLALSLAVAALNTLVITSDDPVKSLKTE